jgi:CSLREA domain-containing protein
MTESKTPGRKPSRRRAVSFGLVLAIFVSPMLAGGDVQAVTVAQQAAAPFFTVDTPADAPDDNVGDGTCATSTGECSLRAAVAEANDTTGATIEVPAGTYVLDNAVDSDTGDLDLSAPMTITGAARQPGDAATTIVGSGDRVFEVLSGGVTLEGLVITGGFVDKGDGGGVLVGRNLSDATTVRNSTVTGNTAKNGAGISTLDELIVESSTFTANTATGSGGGIDV